MIQSYGEPWAVVPNVYGLGRDGIDDTGEAVRRPTEEWNAGIARIVACVNAMTGRDPSKLAELEAAVEAMLNEGGCEGVQHRLRAALRAFRGESDAG